MTSLHIVYTFFYTHAFSLYNISSNLIDYNNFKTDNINNTIKFRKY